MERTALLIEDSKDWLRILRDELLRAGFKIDWASERTEALNKVTSPLFPYRLIVLDPHLGDDLGAFAGTTIAETAAVEHPGVPLVIISGLMERNEIEVAFRPYLSDSSAIFQKMAFDRDGFRKLLYSLGGLPQHANSFFSPNWDALHSAWTNVLTAASSEEKGATLEAFARLLLSSLSLLTFVDADVVTPTGEIDLVFNVAAIPGTLCQEWGSLLLVECKNRLEKAGVVAITTFKDKIVDSQSRVGIMLSLAGLTGHDRRNARARIWTAFERERVMVLVLDRADLDRIIEEHANLYEILAAKCTDVRLRH